MRVDVFGGLGDHRLTDAQYLEASNALAASLVYLRSLCSW